MNGVAGLAGYIADAITNAQKQGTVKQALVVGDSTVRVDGMILPFVGAVDAAVNDGDYVWVSLNESKNIAVVVGK